MVVAGIGIAGFSCADALLERGADVVVIDGKDGPDQRNRAQILEVLGARVVLGDGETLPDADLLVVSPGLPPSAPVIQAAQAQDMPVWGELELAWRVRDPEGAPWLFVTGTNGKTTTTLMLASMLRAAGLRTDAVGNIGVSLVATVMDPQPHDVLAVEVGAPQLPFIHTVSPHSAVCLNVAEDHVDFFGSFQAYRDAKARVYERTQVACVYNSQDPATMTMVEQAEVVEGCRAIGFTLGVPARSEVGVVDDILADRAFLDERETHALELATLADIRPAVPHQIANALAAAALARSYGIDPRHVRDGLRSFTPAAHRIAEVGSVDGVLYIDDSKATNAHAADMSLRAYDPVVWIAGGLAKGQTFDDLVQRHAKRLRAVVLLTLCGDTHRMYPSKWSAPRTLVQCKRWCAQQRGSPARGTQCCWPPVAPPGTCSPITPSGARRSPQPSQIWTPRADVHHRPSVAKPPAQRCRLRRLASAAGR